MSTGLNKKIGILRSREHTIAKAIALQAIRPKPFSVWEVVIPIVFILGYMRSKQEREVFAQNLLFTKKLALEAAFEMIKKDLSREAVVARIKSKTAKLLDSLPEGVYSDLIRHAQIREINLLIDHYCKLLKTDGEDYAALVINAYQSRQAFMNFLQQLKSAEKAVSQAAQQTLGDQTDLATLGRIERVTDSVRLAAVKKIFGTEGRH